MKVNIEMEGTDEGEFNYILEEVADGSCVGRLNYYGMPLSEGTIYSQEISVSALSDDITSMPLYTEAGEVNANEYLSATSTDAFVVVETECEGYGVAIGAGDYAKGDSVKLTAISSSEYYEFVGWYIDGEIVSSNVIYQFTAMENVSVKAIFKERFVIDNNYFVTLSEDYEDDLCVMVCKNQNYSNDVVIASFEDTPLETLNVCCNAYSVNGEVVIDNMQLSLPCGEDYRYRMSNIDFSNCYRIGLTDENGVVIADIIRNVDDTDIYIYIANDIKNSIFISDDFVDADIELYNTLKESKTVWCGMAVYDSNNTLLEVTGNNVMVSPDYFVNCNLMIDCSQTPYCIKIFVLEDLNNMLPITNAITIYNETQLQSEEN